MYIHKYMDGMADAKMIYLSRKKVTFACGSSADVLYLCVMWGHQYVIHILSTPDFPRQAELITAATQRSQPVSWCSAVQSWAICESWRWRSSPVAFCHSCMRSYTWADKWTHTFLKGGMLRVRLLRQTRQWNRRGRWRSRPGSCALQTRFSNHAVSNQTEGMFLHETAISTHSPVQILEPEDAASRCVPFH